MHLFLVASNCLDLSPTEKMNFRLMIVGWVWPSCLNCYYWRNILSLVLRNSASRNRHSWKQSWDRNWFRRGMQLQSLKYARYSDLIQSLMTLVNYVNQLNRCFMSAKLRQFFIDVFYYLNYSGEESVTFASNMQMPSQFSVYSILCFWTCRFRSNMIAQQYQHHYSDFF